MKSYENRPRRHNLNLSPFDVALSQQNTRRLHCHCRIHLTISNTRGIEECFVLPYL